MEQLYRYRAFISYAHADAAWGRWLHRALESFTLPKELRRGDARARFTPVFRDEDELAASADLSEEIRAALRDSENLIVVCSPAAARSRWVAEEVRYFRQELGRRRVFALIVDGEPGGEPDCFPSGMREGDREPLAADLRAGRDRETAKLKLLAGMLGIGFDDLRARETRRRQRRLTAVVGAALATTVAMGGLTITALFAREEAARERERAELARRQAEREAETARQVADFAVGLFDLADPGKAGGPELSAQALADRGARLLETQVDTDPAVRARLQWALGDVYRGLGRFQESEDLLRTALEQRSGAADAETATIALDLAATVAHKGAYAEAETLARRSLDLAVNLEIDGIARRARRELGEYLRLDGRNDEARVILEQALRLAERDALELARTRVAMARLLHQTGEDVEARTLLEQALPELERRLGREEPDVLGTLRVYAEVLRHLGEDPMAVWQRVLEGQEKLLGADHPSLAESYDNMAVALFTVDRAESKEAFNRALEIRRRALPPDHTEIGVSHNNLGYFAYVEGDWQTARSHLEEALRIQTTALGDDHPEVARTMTNLGAVYARLGELAAAEKLLARALELRRARVGDDHIDTAHSLIELGKLRVAQARLGDADEVFERAWRVVMSYRDKGLSVTFVEDDLLASHAAALRSLGREEDAKALAQRLADADPVKDTGSAEDGA